MFATFAKEDANFRKTLHLLPGALEKTGNELAKVKTASHVLGKTLTALEPFAKGLAPAQEATRKLSLATTPIIKNEIRPFAREILPVVNELAPSTEDIAKAFPKFTVTFGVLNEFFNELAYNPGSKKAGFLFFLDWGNHDLNSVVSTSDANGPLGRSLVYFNCEVLPILKGVSEVNPNGEPARRPAEPADQEAECIDRGPDRHPKGATTASALRPAPRAAAHAADSRKSRQQRLHPADSRARCRPRGRARRGHERRPLHRRPLARLQHRRRGCERAGRRHAGDHRERRARRCRSALPRSATSS